MISEAITILIDTLLKFSLNIGYLGTFIWMTIESSFIPWPSEVLLIPQGVLVAQGKMSFTWLLIASILGSLAGAFINYYVALFLGRKVVNKILLKYGKLFFLDETSLTRSERFFEKHGSMTTFVGRLIPGIRQLISLPAGFAKMNLIKFTFYTAIGAGIWSAILIGAGYFYGSNTDLINPVLDKIAILLTVTGIIVILAYILIKKIRKNKFQDYGFKV